MTKNNTNELPSNDEEVKSFFRKNYPGITGLSLCGMYECKRNLGQGVTDALQETLMYHVGILENKKVSG